MSKRLEDDPESYYNILKYEGNWTEDFSHENGNYENRCIHCDHLFFGYKRRVICKLCFNTSTK